MSDGAHADFPLRSIEVDGARFSYRERGATAERSADAHPVTVVLVHGIPNSSFLWRRVAVALAPSLRVLAPDLPGFGGSSPPADGDHSLPRLARAFGAFIDATIASSDQVHLSVHDIGGPVGLSWAVHHPKRVASLCILNTTVSPWLFRPPLVAAAALVPVIGPWAVRRLMHERSFKAYFGSVLRQPPAPLHC